MRVTLRQRQQTKKGTISLYLEYYRGYTKTPEGKIKHKREYEYLDLYLVDNPSTPLERQDNKKTLELAESIRSKRHLDAEAGKFNLPSSFKSKTNLLEYFNNLAQEHIGKKGSYDNWVSAKRQLAKHCSPETTLKDVDIHFVRGFKQYLTDEALTRHGRKLSNGSQCTYFNTFRAGLNRATIDDVIPQNPARKVKNIKQVEVERVFLELDELRSAVKAECRYDVLKRSFLFSCLCGMRVGDCRALTWVKVYEVEGGWR